MLTSLTSEIEKKFWHFRSNRCTALYPKSYFFGGLNFLNFFFFNVENVSNLEFMVSKIPIPI